MTETEKQEINEYLAERLFDLKVCKTTGLVTANKVDKDTYWNNCPCPNYTAEWWRLVEKLGQQMRGGFEIINAGLAWNVDIIELDPERKSICHCVSLHANGIGEAVCRCAVEYLKLKEAE